MVGEAGPISVSPRLVQKRLPELSSLLDAAEPSELLTAQVCDSICARNCSRDAYAIALSQ